MFTVLTPLHPCLPNCSGGAPTPRPPRPAPPAPPAQPGVFLGEGWGLQSAPLFWRKHQNCGPYPCPEVFLDASRSIGHRVTPDFQRLSHDILDLSGRIGRRGLEGLAPWAGPGAVAVGGRSGVRSITRALLQGWGSSQPFFVACSECLQLSVNVCCGGGGLAQGLGGGLC